MTETGEVKWYAMNAFRGGAMSMQNRLNALGVENFVPKKKGITIVKGNKIKHQLQAVIPSLIFIKSTFPILDEFCNVSKNIHFRYTKINGGDKNVPIVISNEEMERFIAFVDGNEEYLEYIVDTDAFNIEAGEKVIITEGPFIGQEATFVKVANQAKRQIVVEIENILGATIKCKFPSRIIEKI